MKAKKENILHIYGTIHSTDLPYQTDAPNTPHTHNHPTPRATYTKQTNMT